LNQDPTAGLTQAPQWALLAGQFAKISIFVGLVAFIVAIILWSAKGTEAKISKAATAAFALGCGTLFAAIGVLGELFLQNQFEFKYVYSHGGADTPISYKIASVWTAQEGSFLLWGCTSALFGLLTIRGTGIYKRWYGIAYASFLAALCGILAYESPFNLMKEAQIHGVSYLPPDGAGMTPSLQNYWVIIHPPTIFMGFGSLTVMFAYAMAAMLTGNAKEWVAKARPWALVSASILGLGLCMGGMWAYETQGWGGFWAWDPVENVSFVPWLFCIALAHGFIVQTAKSRWTASNLFLGGMPFLAFLYGTFLTRSGLLDKVSNHSFASMDRNALIILRGFMVAVAILFAAVFILKGRPLAAAEKKDEPDTGIAREGFYRFAVLAISLFASVVALGMSWPVITALRGGQGSAIEEKTYHMVIAWFFVPVIIAMAVAPFVSWRGMKIDALWVKISSVFTLSVGLTGFAMLALKSDAFGVHLHGGEQVRMPFGTHHMALVPWLAFLLFGCIFAGVANVWRAVDSVNRNGTTIGGFLAHLGFATLMAGMILSRGFEQKASDYVQVGAPAKLLDYTVTYKGMTGKGVTDRNGKVLFDVASPDGSHFEARPGFYMYESGQEEPGVQTWPHVEKGLSHDMYLSLHPPIVEVWETPQTFTPGRTRTIDNFTVNYLEPTQEGPLGQPGAKFGAKLRITTPEGTYDAHPTVSLSQGSLVPTMVPVGPNFQMYMSRMDAADHSVVVQLLFRHPLYPIDLFYKPLTSLVWLGTGILTLGGALSAYARRARRSARPIEAPAVVAPTKQVITPDAPPGMA
jgi:cytochrome c-type biogenesis protein CcmF